MYDHRNPVGQCFGPDADAYQPRAPRRFRPQKIVLTRGSMTTPERRAMAEAICAASASLQAARIRTDALARATHAARSIPMNINSKTTIIGLGVCQRIVLMRCGGRVAKKAFHEPVEAGSPLPLPSRSQYSETGLRPPASRSAGRPSPLALRYFPSARLYR